MIKLWGFGSTGLSPFDKKDRVMLDTLLLMHGETPATIKEIHAFGEEMKTFMNATGTAPDLEKASRILHNKWQKIGKSLMQNLYSGLYYQAFLQDPKLVEGLPKPYEHIK